MLFSLRLFRSSKSNKESSSSSSRSVDSSVLNVLSMSFSAMLPFVCVSPNIFSCSLGGLRRDIADNLGFSNEKSPVKADGSSSMVSIYGRGSGTETRGGDILYPPDSEGGSSSNASITIGFVPANKAVVNGEFRATGDGCRLVM